MSGPENTSADKLFDKKRVEEIFTSSKQEQWTYPKIFNALKDAGVESYDADVASHEIIYRGHGETCVEASPHAANHLAISALFDQDGVQRAIRRNQNKQSNFAQFLSDIAQAGVQRYRVDMNARTVTYIGIRAEEYVEKVPQF
jgi:uncharacterized protein YbcV (DUF1398 family)